jgi:glycosyltransferase involved in cell wall biosynthesis
LKILWILGFPNPFRGACWTRVGFFAKDWSKNSHDISVLGTFTPLSLGNRGRKSVDCINIFNLIPNFSSTISTSKPLIFLINSFLAFIVSLQFLISRRPDAAIVSMPTGDVGLGALVACRLTHTKTIIDYRDEWEEYAISTSTSRSKIFFFKTIKSFLTCLYSKSYLTVTVTPTFVSSLKSRGVANAVLMANGADTAVFHPHNKLDMRQMLNLSPDDFVIVYNGIIGNYYKMDVIIKALASIRHSIGSLKFILVGEGPDLPSLLRLAEKLGLRDCILYLGVRDTSEEIAQIISASDVGIIPGVYTQGQLPVKFFEYCSCGIPVIAIAPEGSILVNLIDNYKVGVSIHCADEIELSKALHKLFSDSLFMVEAGIRGRGLVKQEFDRGLISEQYLDLVEKRVLQQV